MTAIAACLVGIVIGTVWHAYATRLDRINRDADAQAAVNRAEQFAQECLDALNEAEQRTDYWRTRYHRGVDDIISTLRHRVAEDDGETPVGDRVVLDWLDDSTDWGVEP